MTVRRIVTIDAALVADIAKRICWQDYHCYDLGKIESALHSAFYPGSHPFVHGGIATVLWHAILSRKSYVPLMESFNLC